MPPTTSSLIGEPKWLKGAPSAALFPLRQWMRISTRCIFQIRTSALNLPSTPTSTPWILHTGKVRWQQDLVLGSFAPTSAIPGLVFTGSVLTRIYAFDAVTGEILYSSPNIGNTSVASGVVVHKGIVLVGGGIGARHPITGEFPDTSTQNSWIPNNVTALCVPGTAGCPLAVEPETPENGE